MRTIKTISFELQPYALCKLFFFHDFCLLLIYIISDTGLGPNLQTVNKDHQQTILAEKELKALQGRIQRGKTWVLTPWKITSATSDTGLLYVGISSSPPPPPPPEHTLEILDSFGISNWTPTSLKLVED